LDPEDFSIGTTGGVASSWTASPAGALLYGEEGPPPLRGWPEHLFVTFEEEGLPTADTDIFTQFTPQGRIFPVEAYRQMSDEAGRAFVGEWIDQLQALLEERPQEFTEAIPVLPDVGATQDFRGKVTYIDFEGGSGIGFVGHYGQGPNPFTSDSLAYFFQGLTNDGQYYLSFVQPLTAGFLPASSDEVPQDILDTLSTDPLAYIQDVSQQIEEAESSEFAPNLDDLAAMYSSISIE
jgi:hypothetical protein